MKPIINPLWFYLIETLPDFSAIACAICGITIFIKFLGIIINNDDFIKIKSKTLIIIMICTSLIPTPSTCYKMLAASMVTPDNIAAVGETATDIVDYIIESVDTLLEESE